MHSLKQVFAHQKNEKTPVNKGDNQFFFGKSPTRSGEEPIFKPA
jgi:hypothetical protein